MLINKSTDNLDIDLSIGEFKKYVQIEKRYVPWVVMFGNPQCGPCRVAKTQLPMAAEKLINFTNVKYFDLDENLEIAEEYDIRMVPSYKIFFNESVYTISPQPRNYMGIYKSFFTEMSSHIEVNSEQMEKEKRKIILATKRKSSPELFTQLFTMLRRFGIKFYIVTDRAIIKRYADIKTGIIFSKGENSLVYAGKKRINELSNSAIDFFNLVDEEL